MFPGLLVEVLIGLLVLGLILYCISLIPTNPSNAWLIQIARVIVIVFAVIWLIYLLAGLMPGGPYPFRR
jgi:hypothetical protein